MAEECLPWRGKTQTNKVISSDQRSLIRRRGLSKVRQSVWQRTNTHTHTHCMCLINIIAICSICNSPIREMPFDPTCPKFNLKVHRRPHNTPAFSLTHTHITMDIGYPDFDPLLLSLCRTWADLSALCRFGFHPLPECPVDISWPWWSEPRKRREESWHCACLF